MTDWADDIEIQNNGIKCVIDARVMSESLRTITFLGMIAGALLFYSWVQGQIVVAGYESHELYKTEESLKKTQEKLIVEEASLTSANRIYHVATNDLGMKKLRPNQLIMPPIETGYPGIPDSLAMAGSETATQKKTGGNKRPGSYLIN